MVESRTGWTNRSVVGFAGGADPVEKMEEEARQAVLEAVDRGWRGPSFDPLELARIRGIPVRPNAALADARVFWADEGYEIEYNPHRPRGRDDLGAGVPAREPRCAGGRHRTAGAVEGTSIRLSPINSGSTIWKPQPRDLDLFKRIEDYPFPAKPTPSKVAKAVAEVCVVDRVERIVDAVLDVKMGTAGAVMMALAEH